MPSRRRSCPRCAGNLLRFYRDDPASCLACGYEEPDGLTPLPHLSRNRMPKMAGELPARSGKSIAPTASVLGLKGGPH